MRTSGSQIATRYALAVVLGLALVLRFWAIDWGAPYLYHPDEHLVLQPALNIVRDGDLNPHWFQYPSLLIYVQAGLVLTLQPFVRAPLTTDPRLNHVGPWDALPTQWPFALAGRLVVALSAVFGAYFLYRFGARYISPPVGVAAALLLVASPLHNESSHFLTTDVPATTLLTAALAFSIAASRRPVARTWVAAGLATGFAAATKYTAGIVLVVVLAAAVSTSVRDTARRWSLILTAAAGAFLLACPFALLDFHAGWSGILQQRQNYLGGYNAGNNFVWYARYLYDVGLGPIVSLAGLVGLIAATSRLRSFPFALAGVPIIYFSVVASYPSRAERNLIPILPFLCVGAADLLWRIAQRSVPRRVAGVAFACVVIAAAAPGVVACARHDALLARPDTRSLALAWINTHIAAGSRIAREEYTPQVPADRYAVTYLWSLAFRDYGSFVAARCQYLVLSSSVYGRAMAPPYVAGPGGPRFYQFVFQYLPLQAEFTPTAETPGPTIRIYRIPLG